MPHTVFDHLSMGDGSTVDIAQVDETYVDVYNAPSVTVIGGVGGDALAAHINSSTPHPAYDVDLPDLSIYFENGLV